jgi:hypothetical protein
MLDLFPEKPHQNPSISSDERKAFYNNTTAAFLVLPPNSQQGSAMQGLWNGGVLSGRPVTLKEQGEEKSSGKYGQKAVEDFSGTTQPFNSTPNHLKRSSLTKELIRQYPKYASIPSSGTGAVQLLPLRRKRPPSPSTTLRDIKRLKIDQQTSLDIQEFSLSFVSASHRAALPSHSPSPLSELPPPHINTSINVSD